MKLLIAVFSSSTAPCISWKAFSASMQSHWQALFQGAPCGLRNDFVPSGALIREEAMTESLASAEQYVAFKMELLPHLDRSALTVSEILSPFER
jgi:hypothetical protein